MSRLLGKIGAFGNSLADIVAPPEEEDVERSFSAASPKSFLFRSPGEDEDGYAPAEELAVLRRTLVDKAGEVDSLHAQIEQLKTMVRGDSGGATELLLEALRLANPRVEKASASQVIHELISKSSEQRKQLDFVQKVTAGLLETHGLAESAPGDLSSGERCMEMIQLLVRQLHEARASSEQPPQSALNAPAGKPDDAAASELKSLRASLEDFQARNRDLQAQVEAMAEALRGGGGDCTAESMAEGLREQVRDLLAHQTKLEKEHERQRLAAVASAKGSASHEELELSLKGKEREVDQLKEVISQLRKSKNVRSEEAGAAVKENNELRGQTEVMTRTLDDMAAQNEVLQARVASLESQGHEAEFLDAKIRALESARKADLAEAREATSQVEAQLGLTVQQLQTVHQRYAEVEQTLRVAEADLGVARADYLRSSTACSNLQRVLVRALPRVLSPFCLYLRAKNRLPLSGTISGREGPRAQSGGFSA